MSGSHMSLQSQINRFIEACKTGDLLHVQELLNAAADLDASRSTRQIVHAKNDYALRCVACYGHEAICRLLIEHGADIRADDDCALQLAARYGHEAICRLLIEHGADIHAQYDYALQLAAENGHDAVCRLLIEHGADIHAENDYALRWAARNGYEAVCRLLIGRGADIHSDDNRALRWAAKNGHEAVCCFLLELDPLMARHIKPKYSKKVLRVFQAYGDLDVIQEALSHFTDDENAYISSCFVHRKNPLAYD